MKKLTPAQEANYIKRVVERNNAMVHEAEANIISNNNEIKLLKYISETYIKPNNIKGLDYAELVENKIINSKLEADKYFKNIFKSNKPKSDKSKTTKKITLRL